MKFLSKKPIILLLLYSGALLFFLSSDPNKLPLPVLIVPFLYFAVTVFITARFIGEGLRLSPRSITGVATTLSIFVVLVLVLASLHQLTARDLVISLAITSLLSWYLSRTYK